MQFLRRIYSRSKRVHRVGDENSQMENAEQAQACSRIHSEIREKLQKKKVLKKKAAENNTTQAPEFLRILSRKRLLEHFSDLPVCEVQLRRKNESIYEINEVRTFTFYQRRPSVITRKQD